MPGRIRGLSVALCVLVSGALAPVARAQQPKAEVLPPFEVWGVSGKSFGTIRIGQPLLNGILSHRLVGEFVPTGSRSLAELAAGLWPGANPKCLHFNWIQVTVDPGKPPTPIAADGQPQIMPFLDPPVGGYQTIGDVQSESKPADALPWFLDEMEYVPKKTSYWNIHNKDVVMRDALRWYADKYSPTPPDAMRYDTILVLVNDCTSQYEPLGGFHWQVIFQEGGEVKFEVMPYSDKERFAFEGLVTAFAKDARLKRKLRPWTIRPLDKTSKPTAKPQRKKSTVKP